MKPEDIGANKGLPDFLREKKIFQTIVKLNPTTGALTNLDKDSAFEDFYSKKNKKRKEKPQPDKSGYVQNLELET